jgi:hypothetical protein
MVQPAITVADRGLTGPAVPGPAAEAGDDLLKLFGFGAR